MGVVVVGSEERLMEVTSAKKDAVTEDQLREAERGFTRLLFSKRFPRGWIEENAADLLAQAQAEFSERLVAGREDETVGLLIVIAYRRAQNLLDAQRRKPPVASIDAVIHLADESTPTPEQEALDHDRQERIVRAMSHLPDKDCKLLALVYFDGLSIREAGRRLGWRKSAADRHHQAALDRLRPLLGDRAFLSPEIAVPAFAAAASRQGWIHSRLRPEGVVDWVREGVALGAQRLNDLWSRVSPFAEPSNAAAVSGAGRAAVGACGAAVAVCGLAAATGVVGPGIVGSNSYSTRPPEPPAPKAREASAPAFVPPPPSATGSAASAGSEGKAGSGSSVAGEPAKVKRATTKSEGGQSAKASKATTKQTVNEFGVERGSAESTPETSSPSSGGGSSSGSVSSGTARPAPSSSGSSGGGSSSGSEFGM